MTTTLAPDLVDAPSWSIRPEMPIDLDQIHELHRQAFNRPDEAELVDAIRAGADFIPELSRVAVAADGSVLGHVLVSRVAFEPETAEGSRGSALALAPLAVLPPHAGRGIGSALTGDVLEMVDGRDEALVAVVGAPSFYERFGFVPAAHVDVHSRYDGAGPAFQVRPVGDRPIEPGTVAYPSIFETTAD
jgi:putative acetyltransferase